MSDMQQIYPNEIAWCEADGAASINAVRVAEILNEMRDEIKRLREWSGQCRCLNCHGAEPPQ